MAAQQQRMADLILTDPAVESVGSLLGSGRGGGGGNRGQLFINLKPLGAGRKESTFAVMDRLGDKAATCPVSSCACARCRIFGGGGPRGGDTEYRLFAGWRRFR